MSPTILSFPGSALDFVFGWLQVYDDHEIRDDLGDKPEELDPASATRFIAGTTTLNRDSQVALAGFSLRSQRWRAGKLGCNGFRQEHTQLQFHDQLKSLAPTPFALQLPQGL